MAHMASTNNRVIIAGAGPVGLTLALALGRARLPVTVFEEGGSLNASSQASTFHASTLELLDELDMAWPLIETGNPSQRLQYRDRHEGFVAEFNFGLLRGVTRFPIRLQTDQSQLTRLVREELERRWPSVRLVFGTRVVGGRSIGDGDGVEVEVDSPSGSETHKGYLLVGADGAHSAVRKSAKIGFEGSLYESRHLMITTSYDVIAHMPELAPVTYVFDKDEPVAVLTLKHVWRVVFMVPASETDEVALSPERLQERLRGFLPPQDQPYPVIDARIARLHSRLATTFREGRIVLAGDAAHLNHPLGGMGLNSGIHDAYHLATALTEAENIEDALANYATSRRRLMEEVVLAVADRYSQELEEDNAERRRQRNEELAAIAQDPIRAREWLLEASMFNSAPRRPRQARRH